MCNTRSVALTKQKLHRNSFHSNLKVAQALRAVTEPLNTTQSCFFRMQLLGNRSCAERQRASLLSEQTSAAKDVRVRRNSSGPCPPIRLQSAVTCHGIFSFIQRHRWPCPPPVTAERFLSEAMHVETFR
uniref:Uncharacterized protein n=1 Tax=Rhipicephalus zambeziensis TaxID=60191 RepID=A0A224YF50_9ACAR